MVRTTAVSAVDPLPLLCTVRTSRRHQPSARGGPSRRYVDGHVTAGSRRYRTGWALDGWGSGCHRLVRIVFMPRAARRHLSLGPHRTIRGSSTLDAGERLGYKSPIRYSLTTAAVRVPATGRVFRVYRAPTRTMGSVGRAAPDSGFRLSPRGVCMRIPDSAARPTKASIFGGPPLSASSHDYSRGPLRHNSARRSTRRPRTDPLGVGQVHRRRCTARGPR